MQSTFVRSYGLPIPSPTIALAEGMEADALRISIREQPVYNATLPRGYTLLFGAVPSTTESAQAPFADPWTSQPGTWHDHVPAASGHSFLPPASRDEVLAHAVGATLRQHAGTFVTLQSVQDLVDGLRNRSEASVRHAIPKPLSIPLLADVLRRLVDEGVSIRPLDEIIETLLTYVVTERDPLNLTELVRASQKRAISSSFSDNGKVRCHLLSPEIEDVVRNTETLSEDENSSLSIARVVSANRIASSSSSRLDPLT